MTPSNAAKMIKFVSYFFIAFAIVWGLAPYSAISEPSRLLLDLLNLPFGDAPATLTQSEMWLSSIGAGLTAAICIMLLGIVVPAVQNGDKPIIKTTIWAFIVWYIVDSVGSVAAGVPSNAFFNAILLIAILIPLCSVKYEQQSQQG